MEVSRPHWGKLAAAVVCLVGLSGVNLLLPWAPKKAIDEVFPTGDMGALAVLLGCLLAVYAARNLFYFLAGYLTTHAAGRIAFELRERLVAHLAVLPLGFYDKHKHGKIAARVMDDVAAVQTFLQKQAIKLVIDGLMAAGILGVIFWMNWRLAAAAAAVFPLHAASCWLSRRRVQERAIATREHAAAMASSLIDLVGRAAAIKASAAEEREQASLLQAMGQAFAAQMRLSAAALHQKVAADLLVGVGSVGVFCYGGHLVADAQMSLGSFVAFYGYVAALYPVIARLSASAPAAMGALTSFDRIVEVLEYEADETGAPAGDAEPELSGEVEFQDVVFGLDPQRPTLRGVSFRVRAGERVVVTGPNGCGKSSLLGLLPRLYQPERGRILLDGRDASTAPAEALRRQIGFVFQEPEFFDLSIKDNIRYARPDATDEEVAEAAKAVGLHEFIESLPDGYDTRLGADGVRLSLGQKHRLALAQALVKKPRILVIDDAFASLDAASRREVWAAVSRAMEGRTILAAASDPEALEGADRIIYLREGRAYEPLSPRREQAA